MHTYRVAVHGAGWVAGAHIAAWQADRRARVVAVSSRREASARAAAQPAGLDRPFIATDLAAVLARDDVQILSVCTSHALHPHDTIAAAAAGKHILIGKPAALDLPALRAMRDAVRQAAVKTVVGFVLRWNPLFDLLKNQIAAGTLVASTWPRSITSMAWVPGTASSAGVELGAGSLVVPQCRLGRTAIFSRK